jgi:hypothetical protein
MSAIRCPYCGAECSGDPSLVCRNCGKAVERPLGGSGAAAPPSQLSGGGSDRWSEGPPEESANRWSAQPPLGDDSSSSESVSQTSILPDGDLEQPALVRPARSPLVWALIMLAVFLAALIGVIVLARTIRPWIEARKQAKVETRLSQLHLPHGVTFLYN